MATSAITAPLTIGEIIVPNRLVMPPLVIWKAGRNGRVTDAHMDHYRNSLGAGLVIVEATCVSPEGRLAATQLGLWEKEQVPGMARLAEMIRESGGIPGIQIHHAGSKATLEKTYGLTPLAPSVPVEDNPEAAALSTAEIHRVVEDFGSAAGRAVEAGFQVIEAHGAHGYLGSQFLSPRSNRREDEYGGDMAGRSRFLLEVIEAIRSKVAGSALVSVRLGVGERLEGGQTVQDGVDTAEFLVNAGLDLIHISHGGGGPVDIAPEGSVFSSLLHLAKLVRDRVTIPVIGVGGIKTGAQANAVLERGVADLVAVGRGILADPGWARKALSGSDQTMALCVDCLPRCFHHSEPEKCPARIELSREAVSG